MALIKPHQTSRTGLAVKEGFHFTVFWGLRCFNCAKSWWQRKKAHSAGATWGESAQWGHSGSLWAVVPSAPVRIQLLGREKEVSRFQKGPGGWRESKQRQRPEEEGRLRAEQLPCPVLPLTCYVALSMSLEPWEAQFSTSIKGGDGIWWLLRLFPAPRAYNFVNMWPQSPAGLIW